MTTPTESPLPELLTYCRTMSAQYHGIKTTDLGGDQIRVEALKPK